MDFNFIIKRAIGILTKPGEEWNTIKDEQTTVADLFIKYAIIMAAIPAAAGFIGNLLIGRSILGFTIRIPFSNTLVWAILTYLLSLGGVFLMAFIIDALAPSFGLNKDMVAATKIAVYASTAFWVAGIFQLIPALAIIALIGSLYGLFLLYTGIKTLKQPATDKAMGYFISVIVIQIIITLIIAFLVSAIAFGRAAAYM